MGTIYGNITGISINDVIKSNERRGISIGESVSFENCIDGIFI